MAKKSSDVSYRTSPARFLILGALLLGLAVAAYALFLKNQSGG
jgi:hypothetical protein